MTDERMEENSSGDEEEKQTLTPSEQAALARKKRLLEMKSRMHGVPMSEEDYEKDETETKKAKKEKEGVAFRSYQPISDQLGEMEDAKTNLKAVEDEIAEQLRLASDSSVVEHIDLQALAPKKVDWDLKRDITKKMDKLERRTQAAIADLIRERLAEGKAELADAVATAN